uniref:Secreted protein n=1 Tax=Heterorhabditis bacteriophora TaxID=37862 RepID=A0A1I7XG78_HETBA
MTRMCLVAIVLLIAVAPTVCQLYPPLFIPRPIYYSPPISPHMPMAAPVPMYQPAIQPAPMYNYYGAYGLGYGQTQPYSMHPAIYGYGMAQQQKADGPIKKFMRGAAEGMLIGSMGWIG